jgi:hypothetical protein
VEGSKWFERFKGLKEHESDAILSKDVEKLVSSSRGGSSTEYVPSKGAPPYCNNEELERTSSHTKVMSWKKTHSKATSKLLNSKRPPKSNSKASSKRTFGLTNEKVHVFPFIPWLCFLFHMSLWDLGSYAFNIHCKLQCL